jgi:hypothetical protein
MQRDILDYVSVSTYQMVIFMSSVTHVAAL